MFPLAAARKPGNARSGAATELLARAPGLREAGERLVSAVVKGLQTMAGPTTTVEGMLAGFATEQARDIVAAHRPHVVAGTLAVKDLAPAILVTLDDTLVHGLVELFCGGSGVEAPPIAPRAVTPIDQQFAQAVLTLAATAIGTDWADFGFGPAKASKLDGPLNADMIGGRDAEVALVNITIGIFGLHGSMRVMLPPPAVARFVTATAGDPVTREGPDQLWSNLLQEEISRAPVALAAYLDAKDIPLSSLAKLKVGQILALPTDARSRASLVSDGRVLYRGEIGQDDDRYSLRIDEIVCEPATTARLAERRASYSDAFKA